MRRSLFLLAIVLFHISCSNDSEDEVQNLGPDNIEVEVDIKGSHSGNLYGDGTGVVRLWVTAKNSDKVEVYFKGDEIRRNITGYFGFYAKEPGVQEYEVEIVATNSALNISKSKTIRFEVRKTYQIPDLLYKNLFVGNKKWRIDTRRNRPISIKTSGGEVVESSIDIQEKYESLFDDYFVLGIESFRHETQGKIVGKSDQLDNDFGPIAEEPNADGEYENYPMDSYEGKWAYADNWTFIIEGNGFMGSYVGGNQVYEIQTHSATYFIIRTLGADGNYWSYKMTCEEF